MTQKSAIILAIDGLNTSMLPPYGNTLIDTPYFNQLAAQSDTCDFSISDTPDLVAGMRSVWHACHAANPAVQSEHLATRLSTAGVQTVLFTDEPDLSESALAESFDRIIKAESTSPTELATSVDQTWLANFFAQAVACVQQLEPGTLLWIHCRGLFGAWDAPYPIRKQLADEEDPDPPESIEAPKGSFDSKQDSPDVLLGHQQCCAAQLILLDEFLGVLLDQVTMIPSTMLSLMSTRGYPLGEHGQIGQPRELYSEMIHVPLMIRWPETKCGTRIQHLVQPASIYNIICHWFEVEDEKPAFLTEVIPNFNAEAVVSICGSHQSIQTHGWKLIRSTKPNEDPKIDLFKKPDDRWEVNDVADRVPQISLDLQQILDNCMSRLRSNEPIRLSLDAELTE